MGNTKNSRESVRNDRDGSSADWMVNKEKQAVRKLREAVHVKGWKLFVKPGAPGPLSQEALVALKMADCSPIARQR